MYEQYDTHKAKVLAGDCKFHYNAYLLHAWQLVLSLIALQYNSLMVFYKWLKPNIMCVPLYSIV